MISTARIPHILFFSFILLLLIVFGQRGIVYSDEGYVLHGAERVLSGQVPYKDFHFVYTPFSLYATALSFFFLGKSILAGRILMIGISLVTGIILFSLLRKITSNYFMPYIGVLLYVIWAPLHANFPWPVLFAIPLSIFYLYFFLTGVQKKEKKMLFLSGIFAFFIFLTKQNFGAVTILVFGISLIWVPFLRKREIFTMYLLGFFIPAFIYSVYLFLTNSFIPFFIDFYIYTMKRIVIEQTLTTPFIYGTTFFEKIAKFFFYTSPFLLGGVALYFSFSKHRHLLFLPLFVCLFYLVGIRPTTDYIHLTPLLSIIGIPIVILWEISQSWKIKWAVVGIGILFICIGFYSALFRGYYRWEPPLTIQTQLLALPKTHVYLDSFHRHELENIVTLVEKKTSEDDPIFVNGYIPMLYFVTNRKNPTPYDLVEPTEFYIDYERNIVKILQKEHVKLVITRNDPGKDYLGEYIKKEYNKTGIVNDFIVWERRKQK